MTEENFKTVKSSFVDNSQTIIIKINQQIRFTKVQIEKLLKLQLLNMDIQKCISSVASTLKLENIEANELHFWLADTIAGVVKNIEQKGVSIIQGIIIICWFIHYVSLVIEEKCSMAKLFENLCECVKIALANANEYYNIVPLPTHTECLLKFETDNYSSSTSVKSAKKTESRSTVTAVQVMKIITTVIRETFLDDFKYTVVQTAFDTEPLQVEEPNYNNDNRDRCHAIMDKYFLRQTNGPLTAALVIEIEKFIIVDKR